MINLGITESNFSWLGIVGSYCHNLIEKASEDPLIAGATFAILTFGSLYASYANKQQTDASLRTLLRDCEKLKNQPEKVKSKIGVFIDESWKAQNQGAAFSSVKNKAFLKEKLEKICIESALSLEAKIEIFKNVIRNHQQTLSEVQNRISKDIQDNREFRSVFGLNKTDTPLEITIFGGETHNEGKSVFYIRFTNGKEIVYKPRSTKIEALICGKGGYFDSLGLASYNVFSIQEKSGENYGYCDFIQHDSDANTMDTKEELIQYLKDSALMEHASQAIHLTDLHSLNIITSNKKAYAIDPEVVLSPCFGAVFTTGLITKEAGFFEFYDHSKNQIYLSRDLQKGLTNKLLLQLETRISNECLMELGIDYPKILKEGFIRWQKLGFEASQNLKLALREDLLRIVPIDTLALRYIVRFERKEGEKAFFSELQESLEKGGFKITNKQAIFDGYEKDLLNDDIPILFHQPSTGKVFYQGSVIAERVTP